MADASGSISAGPLSLTEGDTRVDNISGASDVDFFRLPGSIFDVPSQVNVTLGGSFSTANQVFALSVVDLNGTAVASTTTGVPTSLSAPVASGNGDYYIKVQQSASLETGNYSISFDAVETAESEMGTTSTANGSLVTSNYLIDGTSFKGALSTAADTDWYTFTTGNVDGSTVALSLTPTASDATFYNIKITDENGATVSKTGGGSLSTTAGQSAGSLNFTVDSTSSTPSDTYFVEVAANNPSTFGDSSEFGNQYTLALTGTTDYNSPPVVTIGTLSSGDYGTTVEDDNVYSSLSRGTSTSLSSIVTVADPDTANTPNSTISSYIIGLQDTTSKIFSISSTGDNQSYTVDGKADPTLTLIKGQTYTFDRSDAGHTLQIQATENGTIGTAYGAGEGVTAGEGDDFTFTVASNAPATLYYQCDAHTAMGGQINIVDNLGTITYTDDVTTSATTINAKVSSSGSGFLNSLSAAEFASANYISASGNDDNQKIYAVATDTSGASSVDTNASTNGDQGLTVPVDTSGIIKYRFVTADSGVTISDTNSTVLIEGNSLTTQTLTATLVGTPTSDVNIIVDAPDDLTLTGADVSVVNAADNTFLIKLDTTDPDDTFTVSALSIADSDGVTETVTLTYKTVSTDTAFNSLSIPSTDFTVQENIASFSISDVIYSSGTNVAEGSTNTGRYTVTANGLNSTDALTLNLSGSGLEFLSATTFDLTEASPTATIVVTAEDDTAIEAGTLNDGVHSHAVAHAIYENDSLSSNYLNAISNKSVSVSDNDDTTSAKTVSISDGSSSGSTAIPDSLIVNLIDSSSLSTSFTSSSGSISVASDLTISHVKLENLSSVYESDIDISDVVLQLRDIVGLQSLSGQAKEAADVDNDGEVNISDVVSVLRHIVGLETVSTFDLVDSSGSRVLTLGPSMTDSSLLLVQNGDVDLVGEFLL